MMVHTYSNVRRISALLESIALIVTPPLPIAEIGICRKLKVVVTYGALETVEHDIGQCACSKSRANSDLFRNSPIDHYDGHENTSVDFFSGNAKRIH